MKQIWLEKDGTLQVLTAENLDDVKRVLVTRRGSLYGSLFYPDSDYEDVVPREFHDRCMQIEIAKRRKLERPKGKWITDKYGEVRCSECNWCAPEIMVGCLINRHPAYVKSNFCWHCGADMRRGAREKNEIRKYESL